MSTPVWLDPKAPLEQRTRSIRYAVEKAYGSALAAGLSEAEWLVRHGYIRTLIDFVLGRRTSFSIADKDALLKVAFSLYTDKVRAAALDSAARLVLEGGALAQERAKARLMRVWIQDEVKAAKPAPNVARRQTLDVVVARRAQRAFTNLAKVEKQAASIEARLKKWREKAAYYEKKGFRPGD